ncbi:MAG: hypothetical protein ACK5IJ_10255 [Mangrovibacterium sp.]
MKNILRLLPMLSLLVVFTIGCGKDDEGENITVEQKVTADDLTTQDNWGAASGNTNTFETSTALAKGETATIAFPAEASGNLTFDLKANLSSGDKLTVNVSSAGAQIKNGSEASITESVADFTRYIVKNVTKGDLVSFVFSKNSESADAGVSVRGIEISNSTEGKDVAGEENGGTEVNYILVDGHKYDISMATFTNYGPYTDTSGNPAYNIDLDIFSEGINWAQHHGVDEGYDVNYDDTLDRVAFMYFELWSTSKDGLTAGEYKYVDEDDIDWDNETGPSSWIFDKGDLDYGYNLGNYDKIFPDKEFLEPTTGSFFRNYWESDTNHENYEYNSLTGSLFVERDGDNYTISYSGQVKVFIFDSPVNLLPDTKPESKVVDVEFKFQGEVNFIDEDDEMRGVQASKAEGRKLRGRR